jgi:hypothetical protein
VALDRIIMYLFHKNEQRYIRPLFPQAIPPECGGGDNPASCGSTYAGNFSRIGCAQKTIHIPQILDPSSSPHSTGNPAIRRDHAAAKLARRTIVRSKPEKGCFRIFLSALSPLG